MKYIQLVKNQEINQAALFYIEGELMNVIVKEAYKYNVGDSIICLLESQTITTKIIKKQENNLYLYISWNESQRLKERRRAVRLPLHTDAQIVSRANQLKATILDISIHGIGFECTGRLRINEMFKMIFTLEGEVNHFMVMVKNMQQMPDGYRMGGLFVDATETDLFYIRRYILKRQLQKLSNDFHEDI